jgi:hypothetical protein
MSSDFGNNLQKETFERLKLYGEKLTVKDVADILGCVKSAAQKRITSGKIRSIRIGRADYIAKEWLIDYLKNGGGLRRSQHGMKCQMIVAYCSTPRSRKEIMLYIGYKTKRHTLSVLSKLIVEGLIQHTEQQNTKHQKYVAIAALQEQKN